MTTLPTFALSILSPAAVEAHRYNLDFGVRPSDLSPENVVTVCALGCVAAAVDQASGVEEVAGWQPRHAYTESGDDDHFVSAWKEVFGVAPSSERREAFQAAYRAELLATIARAEAATDDALLARPALLSHERAAPGG